MNNKQRVFIEEYLQCWNATLAAKRAGYSEKTARSQGQRLLTNVDVSRAIQARMGEKVMSADEALVRLSQQARNSFENFLDENGELDLKAAREAGNLHLLKKVIFTETTFKGVTTKKVEVELYDAQSALVHIGRAHGAFTDRVHIADWRDEAVQLIRDGKLAYSAAEQEFGSSLAAELFKSAGVPVATA